MQRFELLKLRVQQLKRAIKHWLLVHIGMPCRFPQNIHWLLAFFIWMGYTIRLIRQNHSVSYWHLHNQPCHSSFCGLLTFQRWLDTPKNGWFIMEYHGISHEYPIKMDDFYRVPPRFRKPLRMCFLDHPITHHPLRYVILGALALVPLAQGHHWYKAQGPMPPLKKWWSITLYSHN